MQEASRDVGARGDALSVPATGPLVAIHDWLHGEPASGTARKIQGLLQLLIFLNIAAVILETVAPIRIRYAVVFEAIERVSIAVFAAEYIARVASSTARGRFQGAVIGRLRYALTPLAIIDLLAIAPALVPLLGGTDLRSLRAVRLMRLFRVLKLARYSRAIVSLRAAVVSRKEELAVTGFGVVILLVLASTVLYLLERDAQPEAFGSIPAAAWWAATTLTTVGYGDVAPITAAGRFAASLVAVLGIGLFAIPASILGSALVEQLKARHQCPHCGKEI